MTAPRLEVDLASNLARYGGDAVTLAPMEAEFLYAVNEAAPDTAAYETLRHAIWGRRAAPASWLRDLAAAAARVRARIAPWDFAILCQSRIGYRLVRNPVLAGGRLWRGDEELLLAALEAAGMTLHEMAAHLPRHSPRCIGQKLRRMKRAEERRRAA